MAEHAASFVAECYWPEDEVVLCHFEGTADAIRRVAEQARVPYERLLAATVSGGTEERTQG